MSRVFILYNRIALLTGSFVVIDCRPKKVLMSHDWLVLWFCNTDTTKLERKFWYGSLFVDMADTSIRVWESWSACQSFQYFFVNESNYWLSVRPFSVSQICQYAIPSLSAKTFYLSFFLPACPYFFNPPFLTLKYLHLLSMQNTVLVY